MRPPSEAEPADHRFRILSIDGGGIRGVIPAIFLERLETLLQAKLAAAGPDEAEAWRQRAIDRPHVSDCFHMIAGTSTGGLLAAGLTIPDEDGNSKLSAAELGAFYADRGGAIFRRSFWRRLLNPGALLAPKYRSSQLFRALEDPALLGGAMLANARTEVLITSYDAKRRRPRNFTRWGVAGGGERAQTPDRVSMAEVALGSAAAPTYFPPAPVEGSELVDGGVFANNPTLAAVSMALRRTTDPVPEQPEHLLVVSLGTGNWEAPLNYGAGGAIGWAMPRPEGQALLGAILDGQADHATEAAHMILNGWQVDGSAGNAHWDPTLSPDMMGGGPRFWRYQAALPEPWALDDVSRVPALQQLAREMSDLYEVELERLAQRLIADGPVATPVSAAGP